MSDEIAEVFQAFDAQLRPTSRDRELLVAQRAAMVRALTQSGAPVLRVIDAGSWAHGTAVRGVSPLDLVVVLDGPRPRSAARARELLNFAADGPSAFAGDVPLASAAGVPPASAGDVPLSFAADGPSAFAGDVPLASAAGVPPASAGGVPAARAPGAPPAPPSLGMRVAADGVRLIPAFEVAGPSAESDLVVIPDPTGRWVRHRPGARGVLIDRIDDGPLRMLVRLLLAWKHRAAPGLSSYYLETVAIRQALQQRSFSPLWDLCWIWESLAADGLVPVVDPSSPDGGRSIRPAASIGRAIEWQFALERAASSARGAVNAYVDGDTDRVTAYLQALFGEGFPALGDLPDAPGSTNR